MVYQTLEVPRKSVMAHKYGCGEFFEWYFFSWRLLEFDKVENRL